MLTNVVLILVLWMSFVENAILAYYRPVISRLNLIFSKSH